MYKIKNIGKTKTIVYNGMNDRVKKNDIEWSVDYDNKNGVDLNINMDNNGDKSHYHQYLTNSELEELLKMPIVNKSIHQRLLEDFNPYNNTNYKTNYNTNYNNSNLDLITYPHKDIHPYTMDNDLMNYNHVPIFFQRSSELTKKSRPKVIKIKIHTKKHKKHSNKNGSKSNSRSSSQTKSRSSRSKRSKRSNRIR
jgi:hypothetical protein